MNTIFIQSMDFHAFKLLYFINNVQKMGLEGHFDAKNMFFGLILLFFGRPN